jgi:2-C-methyl-D-erythritol 2,4-cyclodiphosphate synthase
MRIGIGYDVHRLVEGRRLILGGVDVPFEKGLLGHSDADVLLHAITDAILGAIGEGDIGRHFPDTDPRWKDADSSGLMRYAVDLAKQRGFEVNNIDSTIVCQRPKLAGYIPEMVDNIASVVRIPKVRVNVKAKTTEGLGFTGTGDGIAAYAVVTVREW